MREKTHYPVANYPVARHPVAIVGAGPGDPDLLTVKALRLLGEADAVVYDRLVSAEVRALIPAGAMQVFVGKSSNCHPTPQDEINDLIVRLARGGRRVVRLKGGDPFVFGRGSEEAEYLALHGISASRSCLASPPPPAAPARPESRSPTGGWRPACASSPGIDASDGDLDLNWASLADPETTLVVYMGLANLTTIRDRLIAAGLPAETPVAAIANGTTREERICCCVLADLPRPGPGLRISNGARAVRDWPGGYPGRVMGHGWGHRRPPALRHRGNPRIRGRPWLTGGSGSQSG